jgi:hypothetical protein
MMVTKLKKLLLAAAFITMTFVLPAVSACSTCPFRKNERPSTKEEILAADKQYQVFDREMHDSTMDSPSDSTTKRTQALERRFLASIAGLPGAWKDRLQQVVLDRLRNDSYACVRFASALNLHSAQFSTDSQYVAFVKALDDGCILVRVEAAVSLLGLAKGYGYPMSAKALSIARSAAIGQDRLWWNVKGFYTTAEYQADPLVVERWKDTVQKIAIICLSSYYDQNSYLYDYLDSVEQHGADQKIKGSAKRARELLRQGTGARP